MNLFQRFGLIFKRNLSLSDLDRLLDGQLSGYPSVSGINISNDKAMNYSAVFNAVQIIAGTIASLPLILYRRVDDRNKERAMDHSLFDLLHNQPNPEMTSFVWREVTQAHLLLWGNSYSHIVRDRRGEVAELWILSPAAMTVKRDDAGQVIYVLKGDGQDRIFSRDEIFHIPGLGFDGRVGYSVLTMARESMGLGLAMEQFNAEFYGQGTHIGGVLEHPGKLGETAHASLVKDFNTKHSGLGKAHRAIVLEEGMQWKPTTMPLQDAQFLESRIFQVSEIARWFNLPPHKLKELSKATFSNIEQQQIEFVQDSIRPWLVRWEQHVSWKLIPKEERKRYFAEFLIDALLRGDMASRNQALGVQRINGIISANEWRAMENMNPIKNGDVYWMPLNMVDASIPEADKVSPSKDQVQQDNLTNFELRGMRSINTRRRYAKAFKQVFNTVTKEILKFEVPTIRKIAKKSFTERDLGDFKYEINEFYTKNYPKIRKLFAAAYFEYANTIYPIAAEEVNFDPIPPAEFTQYVNEFVDNTTGRYIGSSQGQLNSIAIENSGNGVIGAIDTRLDEWEERRPDKVADQEVTAGETGFAKFVYFAAGFRTVWVAIGHNCPYCNSLDGKTVERGVPFINKDEAFQPVGAPAPLVVKQVISHPPAHSGCDCSIRASL